MAEKEEKRKGRKTGKERRTGKKGNLLVIRVDERERRAKNKASEINNEFISLGYRGWERADGCLSLIHI